jgi:hypothetical protein
MIFIYKSLNTNHEPLTMDEDRTNSNAGDARSLYHYRTLAVTEAYASIMYLWFKMLKNSYLICGISFCNQL